MILYTALTTLATGLLAAFGLVLLVERTERGTRLRAGLARALERVTGRPDLDWLRWWHIAAVVALGLAAVLAFDLANGLSACLAAGEPSDIGGFLAQGRALWAGGNPFDVTICGGTIGEPDGLAAVAINAVGSFGGVAGIAVVWGAVAVALVPLTWWVAGPDRRYLTLLVATSPLYFPVVAPQVDGASNALVPVTVLLALFLASRGEVRAAGLAGFLATQRFPTVFAVLGMSGSFRRRFGAAASLLGVFALGTALSYLAWGQGFLGPVFLSQLTRRSFSLNLWGVLLFHDWLPAGDGLAIGQAAVTLLLVGVVFFTVRSPLRAAAITLTGVALLTQFLSINILLWLLPVALVGVRPRWWLWAIVVVGSVNYQYALGVARSQGILWPSELLDVVLTVLLLGLFVDLWRTEEPTFERGPPLTGSSPHPPTRIILPAEVGREDGDPSPSAAAAGPLRFG